MFAGLAVIYTLFPNFAISSFRKDLSIAKKYPIDAYATNKAAKIINAFFMIPLAILITSVSLTFSFITSFVILKPG